MILAQLLFIGTTELMLIAGIALLLFGGKKLPELMRGLGQGVNEFKKGTREVAEPINEVKETIKDAASIALKETTSAEPNASEQN